MSQDINDFRPQIDAALIYAGGTHLFEDVKGMVEREECQFWPGVNSCVVTQIHYEPRRRILLQGADDVRVKIKPDRNRRVSEALSCHNT